jgi:hypothetical protein
MSEQYPVLRFADFDAAELARLLASFQLEICMTDDSQEIPGSYWGDEEAGLIENRLYLRNDTPVHSVLHETCHYICMDSNRRQALNTNAGGDDNEENAVCYLQILLARYLSSMDEQRLFTDMDSWGYSFRLGTARAWFEQDAGDARDWLVQHELIDNQNQLTFQLR